MKSYCSLCGGYHESTTSGCDGTSQLGYIHREGPPSVVTVYTPPCPACAAKDTEIARLTALVKEAHFQAWQDGRNYVPDKYSETALQSWYELAKREGLTP